MVLLSWLSPRSLWVGASAHLLSPPRTQSASGSSLRCPAMPDRAGGLRTDSADSSGCPSSLGWCRLAGCRRGICGRKRQRIRSVCLTQSVPGLARSKGAWRCLAGLAGCAQTLQTRQAAKRRWDGAAKLVVAEQAVVKSTSASPQSATQTERTWLYIKTPGVAWQGLWAAHRLCRLARLPSVAGMVPIS